jgi:integrase
VPSNRTANLLVDSVGAMLAWAVGCGLISTNPVRQLRRLPDGCNEVGLVQVQRLMGHSDPKLTAKVYTHLDVEDLRKAVEAV